MSSARQGLARLGKWGQSTLRVAAPDPICQHVLPAVIREFRESFPQCVLTVDGADSEALQDLLRSQRIDLALGLAPPDHAPVGFRALFEDELVFLTHPLHPWAQAGRADRATLTRQSYLSSHCGDATSQWTRDYFRADGLALPGAMEFGSLETVKELLKAGLGVSILPPWVAQKELAERSLVALPLGRRKLRRQWGRVVLARPAVESGRGNFRWLMPLGHGEISGQRRRGVITSTAAEQQGGHVSKPDRREAAHDGTDHV